MERLAPTRPVLGLAGQRVSQAERVRLHAGDALMLYTDGVAEAEDGSGVEFGDERLAQLFGGNDELPGQHARVLQAVREYAEGKLTDDATLVLIAVGGSSQPTAPKIGDPAWSHTES